MWKSIRIKHWFVLLGIVLSAVILVSFGSRIQFSKLPNSVVISLPANKLGIDQWKVGAIKASEGIYEVTIVDSNSMELFKLKLNATTGQLDTKEQSSADDTPLAPQVISQRAAIIVQNLTSGEATQKRGEGFANLSLVYAGRVVAHLKVDPVSGLPINSTFLPGSSESGERAKASQLVPKQVVNLLGWGAAFLLVLVSLNYFKQRSLVLLIKFIEEGKRLAMTTFKYSQNYHYYLSMVGIGLAFLHALNWLMEVKFGLNWIALSLMVIVALTGLYGRYAPALRINLLPWRRIHRLCTIVFCIALIAHIIE